MTYFIGLDVGTTSTKASAFNRAGEMLAETLEGYSLEEPEAGTAIQDPAAIETAARSALRGVIAEMGEQPAAVGLSTAMHSLIAIDECDEPLTPSITWADTRAHAQAHALRQTDTGRDIFQHTGTPVHAMSPLAKLLWLRHSQPDVFRRARRFVDIKAYLLHRWFGEWTVDHSIASASGLLETATARWYAPALEAAEIELGQLPTLCSPLRLLTDWRREVREAIGIDAGVPFNIGASDGCLANLGAGILYPGPAVLTVGTSGAVRMTQRQPNIDEQARLFTYILYDDYYVTGGPSNNGGKALEWFGRQFYPNEPLEQVLTDAESVPAGADGLLFIPYLYGERAPVWNADCTGRFVGIRSRHTRAHFARAVLEGVLLNLDLSVKSLEKTVQPITEIFANGGFTRSHFWVQMLADMSRCPVHVAETPQASAHGAALLARRATGDIDNWSEREGHRTVEHTYHPDAQVSDIYQDAADRFERELAAGY